MLGHHHLDAGSTRAIVVDPHPLRSSHHYHDVLRLSSRQTHYQVPSWHLEALEILDQTPGKVEIHPYVSTVVVGHGHPVGLHLQSPLPLDVSRPGSGAAAHAPQAAPSPGGSDQEEAHYTSKSQIRQSNGSFCSGRPTDGPVCMWFADW